MKKLYVILAVLFACAFAGFAAGEKKDAPKTDKAAEAKEVKGIKVTASSWEQKAKGGWGDMPPERSLDGDLKTAWMAEGDGEWIQYDFGKSKTFKAVKLAFARGNERVYTFDLLASETGTGDSWTAVLKTVKSSGKAAGLETFEFKNVNARFIRVVGHGNTSEKFSKWCNISEADFVTE